MFDDSSFLESFSVDGAPLSRGSLSAHGLNSFDLKAIKVFKQA